MNESLENLISSWDGDAVVSRYDSPTGSWIFIALHDFSLGRPSGGTRLQVYPNPGEALVDALRLSKGMTHKWASANLSVGGGKAVIAPPVIPRGRVRTDLLRRYGRLLDSLSGAFSTGVDLGTTPDDMQIIGEETGYVHGLGSRDEPVDPGPFTATGVFAGIRAAIAQVYETGDVANRTVLVQGLGDVGEPLVRSLADAGAKLLLADIRPDVAQGLAEAVGGTAVDVDQVYDTPCDVFAPCAIGGTLNAQTIPRLRCRIVAGSANNQLAARADADRLHDRGILYAPDYVINAGGAMLFGLWDEGMHEESELLIRIGTIGDSLTEIFRDARERGETPATASRRRVERILESARNTKQENRS